MRATLLIASSCSIYKIMLLDDIIEGKYVELASVLIRKLQFLL